MKLHRYTWRVLSTIFALSGVLLSFPAVHGQQLSDLVPPGAVWKYKDDGSDQGAAWRGMKFDDKSWSGGNAKLGYGDTDVETVVDMGPDPGSKFITTYFRHTFEIEDLRQVREVGKLALGVACDDGCVVYINDKEVARQNMPSGRIDYRTRALFALNGDAETHFHPSVIDWALLRKGKNVIAVELHQVSPDSSDIGFNLQLAARTVSDDVMAKKPDEYLAELQMLYTILKSTSENSMSKEEYLRWQDGYRRTSADRALELYEKYPASPERWDAIRALIYALVGGPPLIKDLTPDARSKGIDAIVPDDSEMARWDTRIRALTPGVMASGDAPLETKEALDFYFLAQQCRFLVGKAGALQWNKLSLPARMALFDALADHVNKYSELQTEALARRIEILLKPWERAAPGAEKTVWERLLKSANSGLRAQASLKLNLPLDLKFQLIDGKEMDLAKLRGKVVLIDFWGTWCVPCLQQIPNLKKVYEQYKEKGLEVIGIALENGSTSAALKKFVEDRQMTWLHVLDGSGMAGQYAEMFGISSVPRMWVLDKEGKVVSNNANALELEQLLQRLL